MLTPKTITSYIALIAVILIALLLGYQLGKSNPTTGTAELNAILLQLLTKRSDLPLKDIHITRVEQSDTSYSPFDLETNILDYAYIQFSGMYIPTGKHFSLRHHINIYKPGNVPEITATETLYNNSIAHNGNVTLLSLNGMDDNSWGFCYVESETCFIESQYNDVISQISVVLTDADEAQISEILTLVLKAFYERVDTFSIRSKSPIPASTLTALVIRTITPSPTPTQIYGLLLSPDKTKRIQSRDWNNYEILKSDGTLLWTFSYDNKFGVEEPGAHPFHWSQDGKYIYITCHHGPHDSSNKYRGSHFKDGDCVIRIDVDTGKVAEIIPDMYPGYYAFAISPDDKQLVYANQNETPVKIKLLDLVTLEERVLFTNDETILEVGSFGWSPKMDRLIFSTLDTKDPNSIFTLELRNLEIQPIVNNFDRWLDFESWDGQEHVYYRDTYRAVWELNLESKMLKPLAVPTLTLSP
jgi:hypothetical protein